MNIEALNKIAIQMVVPGTGILAADESTGTIGKRLASIDTENTETNRRDWREMLFRTQPAMQDHVSGVILYDARAKRLRKVSMVFANASLNIMKSAPALRNGARLSKSRTQMSQWRALRQMAALKRITTP